jgi:phosphoserine phosphatase RsbU/P
VSQSNAVVRAGGVPRASNEPRSTFSRSTESPGTDGRVLGVLLLEDSGPDAELIEARLREAGLRFELTRVDSHRGFTEALSQRAFDIILSDYNIPGFDGTAALSAARLACPNTPFVFISGALGEERAIELLKRGATDYVLKDHLERLVPSVERALNEAREKAQRKRAEEALHESQRTLTTLMGNLPGMAFRCIPSPPWAFAYASAGAVELTGYQPEDFYVDGCITWADLMHPEDVDRVAKEAELAFGQRRQLTVTYRIKTRDGEEKWVWDRSVGVFAPDGTLEMIEGFVTDITEAKKSSDFEQQLIGIVSHDLRNPLQTILLAATTTLHRKDLDERTMKALVRIQSAGDRAGRLIRDLLDFTQARLGGGIPITPKPVSIHDVVQQVVDDAEVTHPHRQIRFVKQGDGRGEWDPDRLAQVVANLVYNALRYGAEGTPVTVTTFEDEGGVGLDVHNLGEPIPAALQARLFKPMQRGGKAGDGARSVGLGLYIVDHIVKGHGGSVKVHSSNAEGTIFRVRLPRRVPST